MKFYNLLIACSFVLASTSADQQSTAIKNDDSDIETQSDHDYETSTTSPTVGSHIPGDEEVQLKTLERELIEDL
jgi:hypothetical protein